MLLARWPRAPLRGRGRARGAACRPGWQQSRRCRRSPVRRRQRYRADRGEVLVQDSVGLRHGDGDGAEEFLAQQRLSREPARVDPPELVERHRELEFFSSSRRSSRASRRYRSATAPWPTVAEAASDVGVRDAGVALGHLGQDLAKSCRAVTFSLWSRKYSIFATAARAERSTPAQPVSEMTKFGVNMPGRRLCG